MYALSLSRFSLEREKQDEKERDRERKRDRERERDRKRKRIGIRDHDSLTTPADERIWHIKDSHGKILALASR